MKAFYRFLYTLFSIIMTGAAFVLIRALPDVTLFKGPHWFRWLMHGIQLAGFFFGVYIFRVLDPWEFLGCRQAWLFITRRRVSGDREGLAANRLITRGPYGIVRHPLYAAGLIIFTFNPLITRNGILVSVLADLYFIYGALSEERRLLKQFGAEYGEYMKKTPRFLPRLFP
ncbi:MAG: isoprenylcysteine carboxylmethyltransferase family protein [Dissulfurispiraceae bacterium]